MTKILSIDTCSSSVSVSIHSDGKLIGEYFLNSGLTHSQTLMIIIENLFKTSGIKISEIDLFGVTNGPGSFTGIRIGLSTVKGMAVSLGKQCIGISSLYALALNAKYYDCIICSCIDSRCGQVYNAVFETHNNKIIRLTEDRSISIDDLMIDLKRYNKKIVFVGDGSEVCYNISREIFGHTKVELLPENIKFIRAAYIGEETMSMYNKGQTINPEDLVPNYLKVSQAERNLNQKISKL